MGLQPVQGLLTVAGLMDDGPVGLQNALRHLPVDVAVIHDQYAHTGDAPHRYFHWRGWRLDQPLNRAGRAPVQYAGDRVVQGGGGDRLAEDRIHRRDAWLGEEFVSRVGGDHDDDGWRCEVPHPLVQCVLYSLSGGQSIRFGHHPVEQDHVVTALALHVGQRLCQCGLTRVYQVGAPPQAGRGIHQRGAGGGTVVGHQQVESGQFRSRRVHLPIVLERQYEPELAAVADRTLDPQFAPHQSHQSAADGQSQPSPAEAAADAGVGLHEGGEDLALLGRRDPDAGIAYRETQVDLPFVGRRYLDAQFDLTPLGEFDRIAEQIDQDLMEAPLIADQCIDITVGRWGDDQLQLLAAGGRGHDGGEVIQDGAQAEWHRLELQPPGLDLGEVQDVIDEGQQRASGGADLADQVARRRIQRAPLQEITEAQHRIHRGADFVAHIGQKLGLQARCLLGKRLGLQ